MAVKRYSTSPSTLIACSGPLISLSLGAQPFDLMLRRPTFPIPHEELHPLHVLYQHRNPVKACCSTSWQTLSRDSLAAQALPLRQSYRPMQVRQVTARSMSSTSPSMHAINWTPTKPLSLQQILQTSPRLHPLPQPTSQPLPPPPQPRSHGSPGAHPKAVCTHSPTVPTPSGITSTSASRSQTSTWSSSSCRFWPWSS